MMQARMFPILALAALAAACQDAVLDPGARAPGLPGTPSAALVPRDSGYVMRDGVPVKVVFDVRDGRAVFEGDIDLGPAEGIARTRDALLRREGGPGGPRMGVVPSSALRRWNNGVVSFVIEASVPDRQRIYDAIAHIEATVDGVNFVEAGSYYSDYIAFVRTTEAGVCGRSAVGRQGGQQYVRLADGCGMGSVLHELGHALGFWHEQSRCDRDTYVEIVWSNVESGRSSEFDKHCSGAVDVHGYDEGSVMHYSPYAYSKNGLPTIRSRRGLDDRMGQRRGLSPTDASTLNWMYTPYAPANYTATYPGGVPTFSWSLSAHALSYSLQLTEAVEEYISDRGTFYSESGTPVGTTTGTSMTDPSRSYTGVDQCTTYDSAGYVSIKYWYDLYAHYPNGVVSKVARADAKVVTC